METIKVVDPEVIEIQLWEPSPNNPGMVQVAGTKTFQEVEDEIEERLRKMQGANDECSLWDTLDYFRTFSVLNRDEHWPKSWRWIACFVVTGGSEGHYIHVEVMERAKDEKSNGTSRLIYVGKTFSGMDTALEVSNALTKMLGA